ncbi:MAG: hypothetical protein B7Z33_02070 [Sphingomonadales bacterium 12-68-11]|nr:MAG: hypothetical protein B7Z33_02070 [Sphingomonadales bacterium 12-68-11]
MHRLVLAFVPCAALLLGGCLAKTAVDIATLPVKVAARGVDLATTSQAEADRNRGREIRRREARLGELERDHQRLARKCAAGDRAACEKDERVMAEIEDILPTIPVERD